MSPLDHTPTEVKLTKGVVTHVCAHDFAWVNGYKWHWSKATSNNKLYILRNVSKGVTLALHRQVNKTPDGYDTDHIDRNPLNNSSTNLRTVTRTENLRNRSVQKNSTTGVRGVFYHSRDKCWTASIRIDKKLKWLGKFKTKEEAVAARLAADVDYGFVKPY
jgi:HNH endonuclease/AP2 domain